MAAWSAMWFHPAATRQLITLPAAGPMTVATLMQNAPSRGTRGRDRRVGARREVLAQAFRAAQQPRSKTQTGYRRYKPPDTPCPHPG
jgi:hypothetical protein